MRILNILALSRSEEPYDTHSLDPENYHIIEVTASSSVYIKANVLLSVRPWTKFDFLSYLWANWVETWVGVGDTP